MLQDTLLLLEKRVKSRFSHRQWRITSPLAPGSAGWAALLRQVLVPWPQSKQTDMAKDERKWKTDWEFAVDVSDS
jgi:origin recognition complex subunit 4